MIDLDIFYHYIGMFVTWVGAFTFALCVAAVIVSLFAYYFPRIHFGKTKHEGYLQFHQKYGIITYKDDFKKETTWKTEVFQKYKLKRIFGLSRKQKPTWMLALITFDGKNYAYDFPPDKSE